ncbi:MAG: type II secretion system protein [Deltaproteobacteria bacterium]|nr:type II secretion system protein [Deltaproteobacteria bacterium]
MKTRLNRISGFTLIELVITIALAGMIMMMITPYFQSGITTSHRPAQWLQESLAIQRVMESMNGAYGKILYKNTAALQNLSTTIGAAGSSFNNSFGAYTVLENSFISFDNQGDEEAGGTVILKVTVCSPNNQGLQLTQLLTVQVSH